MHSYSIGINSSWWLVALVAALSLLSALWYYSRVHPPIGRSLRSVLTALRWLGLLLLLLALFEPVLSLFHSSTQEPELCVLLDNSASMRLRTGNVDRWDQYQSVLRGLPLRDLARDEGMSLFDESVHAVPAYQNDSVTAKGQRTDIDRALRFCVDNAASRNTQAVLMITDGASNTGSNPLYQAEQMSMPVYVIGIGDTAEVRDLSVQSIVSNDLSYVGNTVPVSVRLKSVGIADRSVHVVLKDDGQPCGEQDVVLHPQQQNYTLNFDYAAAKEGIHKLSASVEEVSGELSTKNNSAGCFLKVLGTKRTIVLFAGAPSPDLSFIRSALEADKSIQLHCYVQKEGAEFYGDAPSAALVHAAEQVIFVGFPIASTSPSVLQMLQTEILRAKPLLFIASQGVDYTKLRLFDAVLPFSVQSSRANEFSITADVKPGVAANPLIRLQGDAEDVQRWNNLPPIFRTETFVRVKPEAEIVASMKVNNVALSDPLILTRHVQHSKCVAVLGYGLYRWKMLGNAEDQAHGKSGDPDVLSLFLQNSTKWLQSSDDERTVRIRTSREFYAGGERVEFIGQVYDAAMRPIEDATVTVHVERGSSQQRDIVLGSAGDGRYTADVDGLARF